MLSLFASYNEECDNPRFSFSEKKLFDSNDSMIQFVKIGLSFEYTEQY